VLQDSPLLDILGKYMNKDQSQNTDPNVDIILNTTATLHNITTFSMAERPNPLITKPELYYVFD
jgi:hypothetical protein